jgi:chemotaxis methyl-accepting protein methylase
MALAPDILAGVSRRLAEHAGLELPAWVIEARAAARIDVLGCDPADYLALLGEPRGADELHELVEAVRVGESRLFRHRSQIDALVEVVVPALRGRRTVRVWSAGCAAGEEPYTLAIVLARELPTAQIAIVATDVSAEALAAARTAAYPIAALDHVPDEWRDGFVIAGDLAHVRPEIAATVRFERANLIDADVSIRDCDVVWCRNVLIYFTPEARRRVIDRLVAATAPGGFIFVGYSESLRDVPELEGMRTGEAAYYVRRTGRRPPTDPGPSRTPALGVPIVSRRTPIGIPIPKVAPVKRDDVLLLQGSIDPAALTRELMTRLATVTQVLAIDLDGAEFLDDELAPVLRRARAAAQAAGTHLELRATRTGARRWLSRHGLDEDRP